MTKTFQYVNQVRILCGAHESGFTFGEGFVDQPRPKLPLFIAGDIFDKWKVSPDLVNMTIRHLRDWPAPIYCVPGQHDLPYHSYPDVQKSSYWTLVEAGVVRHVPTVAPGGEGRYETSPITKKQPFGNYVQLAKSKKTGKTIVVQGMGWKQKWPEPIPKCHNVLFAHRYLWMDESNGYVGAPDDEKLSKLVKVLEGFDAAFFGDNHKGFLAKPKKKRKTWVMNCGTFMRRRSDEKEYQPRVGFLMGDCSIKRHKLDCKDLWNEDPLITSITGGQLDPSGLIELFGEAGEGVLDFVEALVRYLDKHKVSDALRKIIMQCLEGEK